MNSPKQHHSLKQDFISRLSRNKQHLIAAGVLFILPLILYSAIFLGGKQFFGNDVLQWRAAAQSIKQFKQDHNGENPLWETNMFSGMPAYTVSQPIPVPNFDTLIKKISGDTYPLPFYWVILAGFYVFFLIQGFQPLTSTVGAIFISFTTYLPIIVEAGHYNQFLATTYLPWILVGYWLLSRTDKRWLGLFLFALSVALELRANHPQITYYFLYLLGLWWLFDTIFKYRKNQLGSWSIRTGLMIGAGLTGVLCSLEGYVSLYEYAQFSTRAGSTLATASSGGGLNLHYAFQWSQGFAELLTLIIPGIFGGSSGEAYWGPKPFTGGPHYLGAVAFVLALIGLWRYKKNIKYLFLGTGILCMLFSLGYHFKVLNSFMFSYVPFFNKFRTPEMWLIISIICFSVLAVYGIHALIDLAQNAKKTLKPLYLPLGIALALGLLFAVGYNSLLSFEKPGERQQYAQQVAQQNSVPASDSRVRQAVDNFINNRVKPKRQKLARADSIRFFVLVLLVSGLIVAFYKQKLSLGFFLAGLILLASYDMLSVGSRYIKKGDLMNDNLEAKQLIEHQKKPVDSYIIQHIQSEEGYPYRVFPLLDNPFNNAIPAYFYPTIGGYSGAKLSYYQDLIDSVLVKKGQINMPVLDMLNVKYITYNQPLPFPNLKPVFHQNKQYVMENTDVLPKAFFVDSLVTVSSPQAAVNQLNKSTFNPAKWAVVETGTSLHAQPDSTAKARVKTYEANHIVLNTQNNTSGFLVLSEIYYPPGWSATIDGNPAKIYKTNFVLRGMQVPAGNHQITMTFKPTSVYWGKLSTWIGHALLLCLGIITLVVAYRQKGAERQKA